MSPLQLRAARTGLTLVACACLAACGSLNNAAGKVSGLFTPYRADIIQGNFVSKEQAALLKPGMSRAQVRDILGTPLLASVFHNDRWDYVFTLKRQGVEPQARKFTVFFKGDSLERFAGDELPNEAEFVAQLDSRPKATKVPLLEVPEEVLKEFNLKNPPAGGTAAPAPAASPAPTVYPALEARAEAPSRAWDASTQRAASAAVVVPAPVVAVAPPAARPAPAPAPAPVAAAPVAAAPRAPAPAAPVVVAAAPVAPVGTPATPAAPAPAPAAAPVPAPAVTRPAPVPSPADPRAVTAVVVAPALAPVPAPQPAAAPAPVAQAPAAPAAAAPAARAPAAPAAAATTGFSSIEPDISAFLTQWMNDWQTRNANAFFAHYAPEFKGTSGTRQEWEALRRPRIESRLSISIGVLDVRTRVVSPTEARVVFRQAYESDAGSEVGTKAMFLVKRDGRWLIEREFFTPVQ
ncbi:MAG: outer membrane protein assembly factor BamE [Ramlibacter sp.]|jgi:outer membrane protein assembly factor BamE|nr:outer membrane protein assembly factor BamE [Ramlibacter sp.]